MTALPPSVEGPRFWYSRPLQLRAADWVLLAFSDERSRGVIPVTLPGCTHVARAWSRDGVLST